MKMLSIIKNTGVEMGIVEGICRTFDIYQDNSNAPVFKHLLMISILQL